MPTSFQHDRWSSRLTFILASAGFAIGLGNLWRFPFITGENGGGAFVIVYILCAFLIGVPILMAEYLIGRRGTLSPPGSMAALAKERGASKAWRWLGSGTLLCAFLVQAYYSVVGGWTMEYVFSSAIGSLRGVDEVASYGHFQNFMASPWRMLLWHTLFMGITIVILSRRLHQGLERAINVMMPLFGLLLVAVMIYAATIGDFMAGLKFMFEPDFSKLTFNSVLVAIGQAFYSIGIAQATMMTYGAYMRRGTPIGESSVLVVSLDTTVAILAGLAIFPLVFGFSLQPAEGEGLVFISLPIVFSQAAGGQFFGFLLFTMFFIAALTSSIATLEPIVSWGEEHRGISRRTMSVVSGGLAWLIGIGAVLSFNHWSDFHPLDFIPWLEGQHIFAILDGVTANLMMPLGGLLIAIFAGWVLTREVTRSELAMSDGAYRLWRFVIRFPVPLAIAVVLYQAL